MLSTNPKSYPDLEKNVKEKSDKKAQMSKATHKSSTKNENLLWPVHVVYEFYICKHRIQSRSDTQRVAMRYIIAVHRYRLTTTGVKKTLRK